MEYVLQTNHICKSYKNFNALNGLSMNVPKGAVYGFVGRNGSGKTTLIRIICGLQFPTKGEYSIYDRKNTEKEILFARKRMGAVIETPSIYMNMTARENLEQQCRILGLRSFESVGELLELVGLSDTGRKKAGHFSLGMRQRLAIAVALIGNPDFLVLDEPINGLDPQGIIEMRELIIKLNRDRGITILISSHILDELSKIATHYGFIKDGKIVREISAEDLEKSCRKCTRVRVSDIKTLSNMLDEMNMEYKVLSDDTADIYAEIKVTPLVLALHEKNCEVISMNENDESLESYFIDLVGEEKI